MEIEGRDPFGKLSERGGQEKGPFAPINPHDPNRDGIKGELKVSTQLFGLVVATFKRGKLKSLTGFFEMGTKVEIGPQPETKMAAMLHNPFGEGKRVIAPIKEKEALRQIAKVVELIEGEANFGGVIRL